MYRFVEAGRWICAWARRPVVWLALLTWGVLTTLVHLMTPIAPLYRFEPPGPTAELHPNYPVPLFERHTVVIGNSVDGNVFVTAKEYISHRGHLDHSGPIRVWNLREGKLINEFATEEDYVRDIKLSPDGSWLCINDTELYDVVGGRKATFARWDRDLCWSHSGEWIAIWKDNTLQFFDPRTQEFTSYRDNLASERPSLSFHGLAGFSADDRWLIVRAGSQTGGQQHLLLLDVSDGSIAAKVRILSDYAASDVTIARDSKTLAYKAGAELVVMDIAKEQCLLAMRNATWVGWDATQRNVIVFRYGPIPGDAEPSRLESWSLETGQRRAVWPVPEVPKEGQSGWRMWPTWTDGWPVLSPDGSRILWADFHQKQVTPPAWQAKLNGWLKRPQPSGRYFDVRVLNTKSFVEEERWQIPCKLIPQTKTSVTFDWKPGGDRLFVSDGYQTEIWRVPPRSLRQSIGVALILIWIPGVLWYMIRHWRQRKRDTISPIVAPANPT
jgi:hypothetical protein